MATMASYSTRRGHGSSVEELSLPSCYIRNAEANLGKNISGTQIFEMHPSKGLRRISSTLDFFHSRLHDSGSSVFQPNTESSYRCSNVAPSQMNDLNKDHNININNGLPSCRILCPPPSVFFSNDGVMLRGKTCDSTQQPNSRPPRLVISNCGPTAATLLPSNVKFPPTVNVTDNLWSIDEGESSKQPAWLSKENTASLPKLTTQHEWPLLRHQTGLARVNRGGENIKEHAALSKKTFEDSLFPGGLDAFLQHNLQESEVNGNGIQHRLTSPSNTTDPVSYRRDLPLSQIPYPSPMSGKQLIEDLQEYEFNRQPVCTGPNYSSCTQNYIGKGPKQDKLPSFSDLKPKSPTHDANGRKRKGFRRGDDALHLAIRERWACMAHGLNKPFDIVSYHSRFFVIKSNCELDIFASLKYGIWTSTDLGNKRLDRAFCDSKRRGPIYLFFSVSGSGKFCGIAEMTSAVDLNTHAGIWSDKRWRGRFNVQWKVVKDIVNSDLRQFRVVNNDNKPFTNCRDTQEILPNIGESIFHLFSSYTSSSSLLQSTYPAPKYGHEEEHRL